MDTLRKQGVKEIKKRLATLMDSDVAYSLRIKILNEGDAKLDDIILRHTTL
jgi:hypothetical protein